MEITADSIPNSFRAGANNTLEVTVGYTSLAGKQTLVRTEPFSENRGFLTLVCLRNENNGHIEKVFASLGDVDGISEVESAEFKISKLDGTVEHVLTDFTVDTTILPTSAIDINAIIPYINNLYVETTGQVECTVAYKSGDLIHTVEDTGTVYGDFTPSMRVTAIKNKAGELQSIEGLVYDGDRITAVKAVTFTIEDANGAVVWGHKTFTTSSTGQEHIRIVANMLPTPAPKVPAGGTAKMEVTYTDNVPNSGDIKIKGSSIIVSTLE